MIAVTRRAFVKAITVPPAVIAVSASAQNVVDFTVKNQSSYVINLEFWDLANNSHAISNNMPPNSTHPLRLAAPNGKDGRMKYRTSPDQLWYERDYIKNGDLINITG